MSSSQHIDQCLRIFYQQNPEMQHYKGLSSQSDNLSSSGGGGGIGGSNNSNSVPINYHHLHSNGHTLLSGVGGGQASQIVEHSPNSSHLSVHSSDDVQQAMVAAGVVARTHKQQTTQQVTTVTKVVREVKHMGSSSGGPNDSHHGGGGQQVDYVTMPISNLVDGQPIDYVAMPLGVYPRGQYVNYGGGGVDSSQTSGIGGLAGNPPGSHIYLTGDGGGQYHTHFNDYDSYGSAGQYANTPNVYLGSSGGVNSTSGGVGGVVVDHFLTSGGGGVITQTGSPPSPSDHSGGSPVAVYLQAAAAAGYHQHGDLTDYRLAATPSPGGGGGLIDSHHLHGHHHSRSGTVNPAATVYSDEINANAANAAAAAMVYGYVSASRQPYDDGQQQHQQQQQALVYNDVNMRNNTGGAILYGTTTAGGNGGPNDHHHHLVQDDDDDDDEDDELRKHMSQLSMHGHHLLAVAAASGGGGGVGGVGGGNNVAVSGLQSSLLNSSNGSPGQSVIDGHHASTAAGMRWRDPNLTEVISFLNNPNNVIKANAAAYLQHLCYMDDPNKQRTRSLGGIPPLVKLLAHDAAEVYRNACGALRNLSYGRQNDENKRAIKVAGGIHALIALLRRTTESEVKELVTGVIWNMSSCEDLKRPIIDDGVLVIVTYIIIPHSGWDRASPGDTCWSTVFRNASGVLRNVSSAGEYARTKLRECDGLVDALLYVVRSAIEKSNIGNKIVENCVCILRNLSYRCQEVDDPNYDKFPLPQQSRVSASTKGEANLGCFGASKKKKESIEAKEGLAGGGGCTSSSSNNIGTGANQTTANCSTGGTISRTPHRGGPNDTIKGYELLWQPEVVQSYLALLQSCSNPETLEAAAGALQNLAACYWQPSIEIRAAVRKEKGLPILVELLRMEVDRVVCAVATALRNLAIDQRNKELIGKYAMRDLVQKLPSGNPQHDQGTSDDTIAAVLATLNEVIKKNAEFSRSLLDAGGVERLMNITRQRQKYTPRVLKFAGQVLFTMWQHQELRDVYRKHGWKEQDFVTKTVAARNAAPNSPSNANSTLNRPMASQGGTRYEDRTIKRQTNQSANAALASSGQATSGPQSLNAGGVGNNLGLSNNVGGGSGMIQAGNASTGIYQRGDEIQMSEIVYGDTQAMNSNQGVNPAGQQQQQPGSSVGGMRLYSAGLGTTPPVSH